MAGRILPLRHKRTLELSRYVGMILFLFRPTQTRVGGVGLCVLPVLLLRGFAANPAHDHPPELTGIYRSPTTAITLPFTRRANS
jgi:hypothetical protein